jgi:hypothetical protein
MTYTPKEGSYAAKVISYLETQPEGTWITSREIAAMTGVLVKQVVGLLDYACAAGVLERKNQQNVLCFRLGSCCVPGQHQTDQTLRRLAAEHADWQAMDEVDLWPVQRAWRSAEGLPMPETVAAPSVFHLGSML